jgi:hypothetical protein
MTSEKITSVDAAPRSFIDVVDESLTCGICRFVYRSPVAFPCGNAHAFCASCVEGWMDARARTCQRRDVACPCCRVTARESGESEMTADWIAARLGRERAACGCGARVRLTEAAAHYATCALTKDLEKPWASAVPRPRPRVGGTRRSEAADARGDDDDDDEDEDKWFVCMFCFTRMMLATSLDATNVTADLSETMEVDDLRNVMEAGVYSINDAGESAIDRLLDLYDFWVERFSDDDFDDPNRFLHRGMTQFAAHIIEHHADDEDAHKEGVCPICISMPHGDASRTVADVHAHVSRRHGFDWTLYMPDVYADEYELLEHVMRESLHTARANDEANADER